MLVADDAIESRAMLVDLLQPLGFTVIEAANGREALEKACEMQPDLVITDIVMPEMDGREAIRRMRELPQLSSVPVITVSARASAGGNGTTAAPGADPLLIKPLHTDQVLRNIASLLGLEWLHDTLESDSGVSLPEKGTDTP